MFGIEDLRGKLNGDWTLWEQVHVNIPARGAPSRQ
jgi:hypothetical protein